jgi:signal transduction histidine kinase
MNSKLKILMLEDVEDDAGLIVRTLMKSGMQFESKRVDSKEEFTASLRNYPADVILSDHSLPQFNSLEALKICRRAKLSTPFILVTGTVSEEFAVSCLHQGAVDYLLKSNLTRLPSAIRNALNQKQLQEQRRITELELRRQNEALMKVNSEMDSFVYSVSHNIRAPLMSVLGLLNLARHEDRTQGHHFGNYLEMMDNSIRKLDETLQEILEYSRNARVDVQPARINLSELLKNILERLKYINGIEKITPSVSVEEYADFYSDEHRINTIFHNLISNAIKYRDETKPTCRIDIKASIQQERAVITVEDNGTGIGKNSSQKFSICFFVQRRKVKAPDSDFTLCRRQSIN